MNTLQRLLGNTVLAFLSQLVVKASNTVLFILLGRWVGPAEAGVFNLGVTCLTVVVALSAWGLHELLVREVASRKEQSKRYLSYYLVLRLVLALGMYGLLLLFLGLELPYGEHTQQVIRVLGIGVFPEALFVMGQALFIGHERLAVPTWAALLNGVAKIIGGWWVLSQGGDALGLAWVIVLSTSLSLVVFVPALFHLFRQIPQHPLHWSKAFALQQLRFTPGFIVIGFFTTLDFQLDAFLISLYLNETELGWYGAAQTIMLGFWMMPTALRTAIYPLMARYLQESPEKLPVLYERTNRYIFVVGLPICAGTTLLAPVLIRLIFADQFDPAVPALQLMIWSVLFSFLTVPNARLMLIHNRQNEASWATVWSMAANLAFNLWLIPDYGIMGAGLTRTLASLVMFIVLYLYVQRRLLRQSIFPLLLRPALATGLLGVVVWWLQSRSLVVAVSAGILAYAIAILLLGTIPPEDQQQFRQLIHI